jgi:hypothetical protein
LINESFGIVPSSANLDVFIPIAPEIAAISYLTITGLDEICVDSEPIVVGSNYNDWMSDLLAG